MQSNDRVTPQFTKLGVGGDVYDWLENIKLHFEALALVEFIQQEPTQEMLAEEGSRKEARCRRDILLSLEDELKVSVRHLTSAYKMFTRIKKMFVGGSIAEKAKLLSKIGSLRFDRDYFEFMTSYQSLVSQIIALGETTGYKILCMQFLNKLPRTIAALTHGLKVEIEKSVDDSSFLWVKIYDSVLDYLADCGLFTANKRRENIDSSMQLEASGRAFNATNKSKKKKKLECWICGGEHKKKECPKWLEKNGKKNETQKNSNQNWMMKNFIPEGSLPYGCFFLDSGASQHICGELNLFSSIKSIEEEEILTAGGKIKVRQKGVVQITLDNGLPVSLHEVIYFPGAPSLLSVGAMTERGIDISFGNKCAIISKGKEVLYRASKLDTMYVVKLKEEQGIKRCLLSIDVWHARLMHCGKEKLKRTLKDKVKSSDIDNFYQGVCIPCVKGKAHRKSLGTKGKVEEPKWPLELLVADTVGPYPLSIDKKRGALIVGCASTQYLWYIPFLRKSEVAGLFSGLILRLNREFPNSLKRIRTDNGTEFCNKTFDNFLDSFGLKHERSIPYHHEMMGRAENNNRILLEGTRTNLLGANLSTSYWSYAGRAACYCYNLMPVKGETISPWEKVYSRKSNLNMLRIFGIKGYAHVARDIRKKLEDTAIPVRFLGYSTDTEGYLVENLQSGRVLYTRSFYCDETLHLKEFPHYSTLPATGELEERKSEDTSNILFELEDEIIIEDFNRVSEELEEDTEPIQAIEEHSDMDNNITALSGEENAEDTEESIEDSPRNFCDIHTDNILPGGRTRSQAHSATVLKKLRKVILKYRLALSVRKKKRKGVKGFRSYREAVKNNPSWKEAYLQEIKKLEDLGGLKVVPKERGMKMLPFIEVLTEKTNNISGQTQLKVRLAVRGDLQKDRPSNCYSPAAGTTEMRLMIAVLKWIKAIVVQGDCPSAYLNGRLSKIVYLWLPEGHPEKDISNSKVYACPASIYGLAISGQVWYLKFCEVVEEIGLKPLPRAPTMFILTEGKDKLYLQLYVDDFIMGSLSKKLINKVQEFLYDKLRVKCTQDIQKFVGIELEHTKEGLYIHQQGMIEKLGLKYNLNQGYDVPMIPGLKWKKGSTVLKDLKPLQQIFGELNYISGLTRPDVAYSVNRIARKLHQPTKEVIRAAKRILSYLVTTSEWGICYKNSDGSPCILEVFTDASFADESEDKYKSSGGFVVLFNGSVVSWKSKKMKYICTNTGEAEYLALYIAAKEALFIGFLLKEAFDINVFPINIYCDNKAVRDVIRKQGSSEMTKYMGSKYYKILEWIERGMIDVLPVSSKENIADGMTKVGKEFSKFMSSVLALRGSVRVKEYRASSHMKDRAYGIRKTHVGDRIER